MAVPTTTASRCVFSWGGGDVARGWRGRSAGTGPAKHASLDPIHAIRVSGSRNSLAIGRDGSVLTWGFNNSHGGGDAWFVRGGHSHAIPDSGQLGRFASSHASASSFRAAPVIGLLASEGASEIASGRYHALAIGSRSGGIYSWGLNDVGQCAASTFLLIARPRHCMVLLCAEPAYTLQSPCRPRLPHRCEHQLRACLFCRSTHKLGFRHERITPSLPCVCLVGSGEAHGVGGKRSAPVCEGVAAVMARRRAWNCPRERRRRCHLQRDVTFL